MLRRFYCALASTEEKEYEPRALRLHRREMAHTLGSLAELTFERGIIAMKRFGIFLGILLATVTLWAQPGPPKSPAAKETVALQGKTIEIAYSSPRVNGRAGKLFGKDGRISHDPTYPVWRAGADKATTLTTEAALKIGDLEVPKGSYTLFVDLSDEENWVLVVNKQTGQWGTVYDKAQDLGRVPLKTVKLAALVEELKYTLADEGDGKGTLTLAWENVSASVPLEVVP